MSHFACGCTPAPPRPEDRGEIGLVVAAEDEVTAGLNAGRPLPDCTTLSGRLGRGDVR